MSKWKEYRLGDNHIDLISGFAFKSKNFLENQEEGYLPVIKIKNVANGDVNLEKVVYHKYDESLEKYKISYGDVLIAMTGNHPHALTQVVGDVSKYKLKTEALLNQRVGKIIVKGNNDLNFFYYFFKDDETHRYLANNSSGSANQANISKNDILGIISEIPEPIEQRAIAEVLSSLDDKIDLLHRQNKTLEQMAETLFRQWFIEDAKEDWQEVKLGDFFPVKTGKKNANISTDDGLYPFFTCSQEILKAPSFSFEGNAILLAGNGDFNVKRYKGKFEVYQRTYVLIPYDEKYVGFLYTLIKFFLREITGGYRGSVISFITKGMIENFIFKLPKDRDYAQFNSNLDRLNEIYEKIDSNSKQIRTLENMRDTLLSKLVSGEIKVKIDE